MALLATRGTRRAILPSQRWAPLVHVVCGLLLLGAFPLVVHLGANSLFAKPKLEDLTLCSKAEVVGRDYEVRVTGFNASTTNTVPIFLTPFPALLALRVPLLLLTWSSRKNGMSTRKDKFRIKNMIYTY